MKVSSLIFFLALMPAVTLAGEGATAVAVPSPITLKPGQEAAVGGIRLRFVEIIGDSRCPRDVECVWSGAAVAQVEVTASDKRQTVYVGVMGTTRPIYLDAGFDPAKKNELVAHLKQGAVGVGGKWKLSATHVDPYREKLAVAIKPDAYILTLVLERE